MIAYGVPLQNVENYTAIELHSFVDLFAVHTQCFDGFELDLPKNESTKCFWFCLFFFFISNIVATIDGREMVAIGAQTTQRIAQT